MGGWVSMTKLIASHKVEHCWSRAGPYRRCPAGDRCGGGNPSVGIEPDGLHRPPAPYRASYPMDQSWFSSCISIDGRSYRRRDAPYRAATRASTSLGGP